MSATVVHTPEEFSRMPEEYRDLAMHQMKVHAEGELSGCDDYLQVFFPIAPNAFEKKVCCERAAEEMDHFMIASKVLAGIGVDTSYMMEQKLLDRELYASREIHGVRTWPQRGLFSFIGEDAVLDHIKEMAQSSYLPWAQSFKTVVRDEHVHIAHGERIVRGYCKTDEGREEVQKALDEVWPFVLTLFGRPESRRSRLYLKWGLRQKSNLAAREAYIARTIPKLEGLGLTVSN